MEWNICQKSCSKHDGKWPQLVGVCNSDWHIWTR
jgi:hypothetical protein